MAAGMIEDSRNLLDSDDSDEEETVFDYQSQNDKQIGKQLILLFTWATMGLVYAIPGPNLLAISCTMKTTVNNIGLIFTGRAVGTLGGKLLSHWFINQMRGYGIVLLSLVTLIVLVAVFPLAKGLEGAICIMVGIGFAFGITAEGYRIMDISNGLYKAGNLNKKAFALSVGAALSPMISSPFLKKMTKHDHYSNYTTKAYSLLQNDVSVAKPVIPGITCPTEVDYFAKSFWLATIPCVLLLIATCYSIFCSTEHSFKCESGNHARCNSNWSVYIFRVVLFAVLFLYQGIYRIVELVMFTYIILGPFDINSSKASLLVMMLWSAFAFGHILQHIILLKVVRAERQLGIVFIQSCICFVMSILLLKIGNSNMLTISLFVYMFFVSELGPLAQEIFLNQGILTDVLTRKLSMYADAIAEAIFPVASLALMYHKGWQAFGFTCLVISIIQFLACTFLALCPSPVRRDMLSLNYENLSLNTQEDGNGRKIRKEIKKLLGGYSDQGVSYITSDEEVVFDTRRQQNMK